MAETMARPYLQESHHSRVSWAVQDFVNPQLVSLPLI